MSELDHIVITAATLAEGVEYIETALGVKMDGGGVHTGLGTHNKLLSLGRDVYLEVIAPNPEDLAPKSTRMFDLDNFQGNPMLSNWVIRSKNINQSIKNAPKNIGEIQSLSRGNLQWLMTKPAIGMLPFDGAFPALIEWQCPLPAPSLRDAGCHLLGFEIGHPYSADLSLALAPFVNDPRISCVQSKTISMCAKIMTPAGIRVLQ